MMLKEKFFSCRVFTPMFMAGADGREPELRPSEFKGMLRYWWRAMVTGEEAGELKREEEKIFGGADQEMAKSKVLLRIEKKNCLKGSFYPLPHRKNFKLPAIAPESSFQVKVSYPEGLSLDPAALFQIATILGGFGKRSRRGFGSIEAWEENDLKRQKMFFGKEFFFSFLFERLCLFNSSFELEEGRILNGKKGGKYPWIREIGLGKKKANKWDDLLEHIGSLSSDYAKYKVGCVEPKRFASPLYISVVKIGAEFYPVYTVLNVVPPTGLDKEEILKGLQQFKESL